MAHLGADVAAFVDGQLSGPAMREASIHLETCDVCEKAVRQQRLLKSRMSTVATPEPPAALMAQLAALAAAPPAQESWWARIGRSMPFRAGIVLVSASVAVMVTAYAIGSPDQGIGDEVAPPYNRYAADFTGTTAVEAGNTISETTMNQLDGSGWPCHAVLAGDLHRVAGAYTDSDEVVALSYTDGLSKLNLFEQNGRLDRGGLHGFEAVRVGGSDVWIREGSPTLVTWDEGGTVFTIVTDVDRSRLERAVAQLPTSTYDEGLTDRVGDGLSRMTTWVHAA